MAIRTNVNLIDWHQRQYIIFKTITITHQIEHRILFIGSCIGQTLQMKKQQNYNCCNILFYIQIFKPSHSN